MNIEFVERKVYIRKDGFRIYLVIGWIHDMRTKGERDFHNVKKEEESQVRVK